MKTRVGWTLFWIMSLVAAMGGLMTVGLPVPFAAAQGPSPGSPKGSPPATTQDAPESELARFVTSSASMLLVETPDHGTVWAFIADSGRWAKLSLRPSAAPLTKLVKMEYAMIETEDAIHTFSKQAGTWSSLDRKPGVKFAWIQRAENMAVASMGSWIYVFSPKAGTWSSVDLLNP